MPHCYYSSMHDTNLNNIFLIENPDLIGILNVIGVQSQLRISFGTALVCSNILYVEILPPHTRIVNLQCIITH